MVPAPVDERSWPAGVVRLPDARAARLRALDVTYPEIGTTRHPGPGLETSEAVLGTGPRSFRRAADLARTWQVHARAGLRVAADTGRVATGGVVVLRWGPLHGAVGLGAPCRVVWTVTEPDRFGYAIGTLPGHPESGEEAFVVGLDADDVVRLRVTVVARPARWWAEVAAPLTELARRRIVRGYLRSLT